MTLRNAILTCVCACGLCAAADAPYAGTWKMNAAKSNFGDTTVTYEQMPGGEMKATMDGQTYTFKNDGKDVMTPWGMTMAWKSTDANNWSVVEKTNGKISATGAVNISSDGKSMTVDMKRVKGDGTTSA